MDLSLEWGYDHLDLEGSVDTEWAKWVNDTQLQCSFLGARKQKVGDSFGKTP
jgi:hypothetical protein